MLTETAAVRRSSQSQKRNDKIGGGENSWSQLRGFAQFWPIVDVGKTTLSEDAAVSGRSGAHAGASMDHQRCVFGYVFSMERQRGIATRSFPSKPSLPSGDGRSRSFDTPGHVDFSSEMERTLQVFEDAAILVVSGTDGVQGHTQTLWGSAAPAPYSDGSICQ